MFQVDSLSRCIEETIQKSSLSDSGLSQVIDSLESVAENVTDTTKIDAIFDYFSILNNHLDIISQSLTTPATVWGMSEGLARVLIPSLVSLGVFIAGLLINVVSNRSRVNSFKKTILFWSEQLLKQIDDQSKEVLRFSQQLSTTSEIQGIVLGKYQIQVEPLNSISLQKYIHAFRLSTKERTDGLTKEKIKKGAAIQGADYYSYGLFSQFSYLEELHKRVFEEYDQYQSFVKQCCKEWNDAFAPLNGLIQRIINSGCPNSQALESIVDNFVSKVGSEIDITVYENMFIKPIHSWALHNNNHSNCRFVHDVIDYLSKLERLIFGYRLTMQGYSSRFKTFSELYRDSCESISNSARYFKGASTKLFVGSF